MKIYDCFTFFNELDLLEIRFNILDKYVDYFVLAECSETFSGLTKPLYYEENKERFAKWKHKIIHHVNDVFCTNDSFKRAHYQKENIMTSLVGIDDNDLVYYGDLDEIWKPQNISDDKIYKLKQLNYSYYLNNRSSEQWIGTLVGRYKSIVDGGGFNFNRANPTNFMEDGGWHFTNMGGVDQIKKKIESYDHQEYNLEWIKSSIESRMMNNQDFLARSVDWKGIPFTFRVDESELPEYLMNNKDLYKTYFK